jgi:hypothetical protein
VNIPAWVYTIVGALTAVFGYLTSPGVSGTLPAAWAAVIMSVGGVVGVVGQILQQLRTHAVALNTNAIAANSHPAAAVVAAQVAPLPSGTASPVFSTNPTIKVNK